MSIDVVDDLHAAEDYAGTLQKAARAVIDAWELLESGDTDIGEPEFAIMRHAIGQLDVASFDDFCRPSCDECDDDCGCQAHEEGQPHHDEVDDDV